MNSFNLVGIITKSGFKLAHSSILISFEVPTAGKSINSFATFLYISLVFALASIPTNLSCTPKLIKRDVEI